MTTLATPAEVVEQEEAFSGPACGLFRRTVLPATAPWARVAMVPGYGDHSGRYLELMRWLARRGVATHAVDVRGHGKAEGRRGYVPDWHCYLDDLAAFLKHISDRGSTSEPPLFMLGHSHGGLLVAAAGERGRDGLPGVQGCILSAPYLRGKIRVPPGKLLVGRFANWIAPGLHMDSGLKSEWMSSDPDQVQDSVRDPLIFKVATPRWYFGSLTAQIEVMRRAGEFDLPLLILAGDADPVADHLATYEFIHEAGSEDKSLRILQDELHEILREKNREETFGYMLEWIHDRVHPDRPECPTPN